MQTDIFRGTNEAILIGIEAILKRKREIFYFGKGLSSKEQKETEKGGLFVIIFDII